MEIRTDKEGTHKVVCYDTKIVSWDNYGIILNSGGWKTATTKKRMNEVSNQFGLGFKVYQCNGDWFVLYKGQNLPFYDDMLLEVNKEVLQGIEVLVDGGVS